jgi:hypothetical protein
MIIQSEFAQEIGYYLDAIRCVRNRHYIQIAAFMKEAWEVGKRGEDLEITNEPDDED